MKQKLLIVWMSVVTPMMLSACNGGITLSVPGSPGVESSPIDSQLPDTTPDQENTDPNSDPTPSPTPSPTPDPNSDPSPSPSPTPTPNPDPNAKSRVFVSKAVIRIAKANTRALFDSVCKRESKKAKLPGKYTALVGMTTGKFSDQFKVEGRIYQVEKGKEIPVAESFQDLIDGKNNAIFVAACGVRLDDSTNWAVWTGNTDFNKPSREDLNCKNWGNQIANGVVGWLGATGSNALAMEYRDCYEYAHVYCIEHQ